MGAWSTRERIDALLDRLLAAARAAAAKRWAKVESAVQLASSPDRLGAKGTGLARGFNDMAIQLAVGADEEETLQRVDAILEAQGLSPTAGHG